MAGYAEGTVAKRVCDYFLDRAKEDIGFINRIDHTAIQFMTFIYALRHKGHTIDLKDDVMAQYLSEYLGISAEVSEQSLEAAKDIFDITLVSIDEEERKEDCQP